MFFPISWREEDQVSNVKMTSQARKTLDILLGSKFRREAFWAADHRAQAVPEYRFDILWRSGAPTAAR